MEETDKRLEDIEFHQEFIKKDSSSPLHLIREKEMEISGHVLKAKKKAEEIVSKARRKAAEIVHSAETEGAELAEKRRSEVATEAAAEVERLEAEAAKDLEIMEKRVLSMSDKAVVAAVKMITDA